MARSSASPFPGLELHFTEWSASYSSRDPVHDHYFSAPYILSTLKRVSGARAVDPGADLSGERARAKRSSIRPPP